MLSNLSRRIARRNPNRPSRNDKSLAEIDESGPKSGPENGPTKSESSSFAWFSSSYRGFGGAQEGQSINLDIHLIIDT
jgi:hypothetical protein